MHPDEAQVERLAGDGLLVDPAGLEPPLKLASLAAVPEALRNDAIGHTEVLLDPRIFNTQSPPEHQMRTGGKNSKVSQFSCRLFSSLANQMEPSRPLPQ